MAGLSLLPRQSKAPGANRGRLPFEALCRFAVSDMLQHSFDGSGGKLEKKIVKPVFLQHKPTPVTKEKKKESFSNLEGKIKIS